MLADIFSYLLEMQDNLVIEVLVVAIASLVRQSVDEVARCLEVLERHKADMLL